MKELRIIVAGGRDFDDYECVRDILDGFFRGLRISAENFDRVEYIPPKVEIVSGGAKGADWEGECYALANDLPCVIFNADWNKHGKAAGPIRNRQMAEYASSGGEDCRGVLFAFWDGESRGTKNMIETAEKYGLEVHVVRY